MKSSLTERSAPARHLLDVRVCRALGDAGRISTHSTVFCPRHERSVSVDACSACDDGGGLHLDPALRKTSVVCKWQGTSIEPADDEPCVVRGGRADPNTPLTAVMSRDVICVRPELSVDDLLSLFLDRGVSGVPVVDSHGKPLGVVSKTDVIRDTRERGDTDEIDIAPTATWQAKDLEVLGGFHVHEGKRVTAAEIMTPVVLTLHESANIGQAAALMAYEGVHRLPIVSDDGQVVGLLSTLDILRWFGRRSGYLIPPRVSRVPRDREAAEAEGA
jgi:CBS domain-containing protein